MDRWLFFVAPSWREITTIFSVLGVPIFRSCGHSHHVILCHDVLCRFVTFFTQTAFFSCCCVFCCFCLLFFLAFFFSIGTPVVTNICDGVTKGSVVFSPESVFPYYLQVSFSGKDFNVTDSSGIYDITEEGTYTFMLREIGADGCPSDLLPITAQANVTHKCEGGCCVVYVCATFFFRW